MKNLILKALVIFCIANPAVAQIPSYVPANGLVGWWPFNGNANDESNNGNNGIVNGAVLTNDRSGIPNKAYSFNGSNSYIISAASNLPLSNSPLTISAWFNLNSLPTLSSLGVVSWGQWATNDARYIGFRQGFNNQLTYAQYYNDVNCTFPYMLNKWYHYVVTYSNNSVKFYINGGSIGTFTISSANTLPGSLFFGASAGNTDFFSGSLDDIGVWNRALTQCEIQQLYNSTLSLVNVSSSAASVCTGQSATLSASGASSYTWVGLSSIGSSVVVSPLVNTSYTVTGTGANGCSMSAVITQSVNLCTGINDISNSLQKITIYPNPTKGVFLITGINRNSLIEIYDVIGNLIFKKVSNENTDLDLLAQPPGVYFIHINFDTSSIIKKIVRE